MKVVIIMWIMTLSDLSSEKKATSHPEVRADKIRKIKIKIIFTITEI